MENKKVLFITYDLSGYYDSVYHELKKRYADVSFYNTVNYKYRYKSIFEKIYSFFLKITKKENYKNWKKYHPIIQEIANTKFDIVLIVRPDLFTDSQLGIIKGNSDLCIAFYHDSINNIPRKKNILHFFDKVYSYEKKDVLDFNLNFLSNFIYFDPKSYNVVEIKKTGFSVMSFDYRITVLRKIATIFKANAKSFDFFVKTKKPIQDATIKYFDKSRMSNQEVIANIIESEIIVDVHKYGIQDGLTFRTFEALGFGKKLITTNKDIVNYDFYNPNNIFAIENTTDFSIPSSFFTAPYVPIDEKIVQKYCVSKWVDTIIS